MKQIFSTHPHSDLAPCVTKLKLFTDNSGKLFLITCQTSFLEDGAQSTERIWAGNEKQTQEWDFNDTTPEDLRYPFRELALRNPGDFKFLYYILKEHDEKMFPIIQSVLKEVQQLYNFE